MSFNFPASPSNGQTYTPVGGPVFTWDGTAWKALSQGMPVTVFVGDVAPGAPAFGNLWWESDTGNLYIYYNDGDSAQWVQINGTPAGYQTADTRNRIVNGAMQISQENGDGSGSTTMFYFADQWFYQTSGLTGAMTWSSAPVTVGGWFNRATAICTVAQPSVTSGYAFIKQPIEGNRTADFEWGATAGGKPALVRIICLTNLAGTYTVVVRNSPVTHCYLAPLTISAAEVGMWVEKIIPVPPPPVGSVWSIDNTCGIEVLLTLAHSATSGNTQGWGNGAGALALNGQANFVSSTANRFYIAAVGLYLDPDNTGVAPKWQMPDEAEELRACQRYWMKVESSDSAGQRYASVAGANWDAGAVPFPTMLRIPGAAATVLTAPTYVNCSAVVPGSNSYNDGGIRVTVTAAGIYRAYNGNYAFNARL